MHNLQAKSINLLKHSLLKYVLLASSFFGFLTPAAFAEVTLERQVKITDFGLHFNGKKITSGTIADADSETETYDYYFGRNISAHGDSVKRYKNYVFMTWYRGDKFDRHVMLSRYNTETGSLATIEFPHQHVGFKGNPLIGESHNTIAVSISPLDGSIHLLYDMHAYSPTNPSDGSFSNDYFRYSFSIDGAAEVADDAFTLAQFVKDTSAISDGPDDYKHLTMTGDLADKGQFSRLTYPTFFTNTDGTLLLYMRLGGNNNGAYMLSRYDHENNRWSGFTKFNQLNAQNFGSPYNWGLYGAMKYVNGKLRVGFQQRSNDNNDKYQYQNGIYYAYSDHPEGAASWKNHRGEPFDIPLALSDTIKVYEPGDLISQTGQNQVYIVSGFDWTVTQNEDIHIISAVRTTDRSEDVKLHSYKPAGADEFIHSTDFVGASNIYTSGNSVYIIGLDSGYPFVERATGGTNDFVRVYDANEGMRFDHGRAHINDGKLYYYLMERSSGSAQPLHLQIIDLDTDGDVIPIKQKPRVSFPQASINLEEGYESLSFRVEASSPDSTRQIVGVKLYANGELIREDSAAPYVWGHKNKPVELLGLPIGTNTFTAVATDDQGVEGSATMLAVVTGESVPVVVFPNERRTVYEGYTSQVFTVQVTSSDPTKSITSVKLYANDRLVRDDTRAPYNWGHRFRPEELLGLPVGLNTFTAVATDSAGTVGEGSMEFEVLEIPAPSVNFTQNELIETAGYTERQVNAEASSLASHVAVTGVSLYLNDNFIREDSTAPYVWGHKSKPEELLGLPVGVHTVKLVAMDDGGRVGETSMPFIVKPKLISAGSESLPYIADNMFDGDTSDESRWSVDDKNRRVHRVVMDLGDTVNVVGTKLWSAGGEKLRYQVYVSDYPDRSFKKVVNDMKRAKSVLMTEQPMAEEFSVSGRYVKLMVHSLADGSKTGQA